MILFYSKDIPDEIACPHTRGDDPIRNNELARAGILVPTRVGMIPVLNTMEKYSSTCPHTRGDDPRKVC